MGSAQLLVRREEGREAGLSELGEIWVRSPHLALGYLDPELTRARFLGEGPARVYRTGDLGRYGPGGVVAIAGRRDRQVGVRGFRVELGEVEAALAAHPEVRDAVATLDAEGRLVGYVTARAGARPEPRHVRESARALLPEAMAPAAIVLLEELPRTPNGKIDVASLPPPELAGTPDQGAPRTPEEEILCGLFAELLGLAEVGPQDRFFDLGGHSLLATRLISRIRGTMDAELPLRALFEAPTPALLARAVVSARRAGAGPPPIARAEAEARRPLSYSQRRIWSFERAHGQSAVYNLRIALRIRGPLDAGALGRACDELERRHEALRTRIVASAAPDAEPEQRVDPPRSGVLAAHRVAPGPGARDEAMRSIEAEVARPFDIAHDPPWRASLWRLGETEHDLAIVIHHTASDGWSNDLIVRELSALYAAYASGAESPLEEPGLQYADWAAWQREWLASGELRRQVAWWVGQLEGAAPTPLPADRPRPRVRSLRGRELPFEIGADVTGALVRVARGEGATLFQVLLAAFAALLGRIAGSPEVVIGTPVSNRTIAESEPIVGYLANLLAIRARVSPRESWSALLARVRRTMLDAYAHQDAPFEAVVDALGIPPQGSRSPLFDALFVVRERAADPVDPADLAVEPLGVSTGTAPYDLTLAMTRTEGKIAGFLEYDLDLFEAATAEALVSRYVALASALARDPAALIEESDPIAPAVREP